MIFLRDRGQENHDTSLVLIVSVFLQVSLWLIAFSGNICWAYNARCQGSMYPPEQRLKLQKRNIDPALHITAWHYWWSHREALRYVAVCQNLVPLVNIKIAGKWMFIPLKMVLIGIDPYPCMCVCCMSNMTHFSILRIPLSYPHTWASSNCGVGK